MAEVLIFMHGESTSHQVDLHVNHRVSPRMFVVADTVHMSPLRADASANFTEIEREADLTDELQRQLNPDERLFAKSWLLRRSSDEKARLADGADWDAPGFEAPDEPPRMCVAD